MDKRPLVFLGKISFSLYLMHFIIICSVSSYVFIKLFEIMSYNMAVLLTLFITIAATIIFSYYTQKYIDSAGIKASWKIYDISKHAYEALKFNYMRHYRA
jgi:peptidoglycan/LPS O-acetylase OafA/YrhL